MRVDHARVPAGAHPAPALPDLRRRDRADRGGLGGGRRHGRAPALARRELGLPGRRHRRAPPSRRPPLSRRERRDRRRRRARTGSPCAVALAARGRRGDGARGRRRDRRRHAHQRADVPGVLHDDCSAVHPMAVGLAVPAIARPRARTASSGAGPRSTSPTRSTTAAPAVMLRSIDATAAGLGADGRAWRRMFGAPVGRLRRRSARTSMRPVLHVPRHPLRLVALRPPGGACRRRCSPGASADARRRGRCSAASPRTRSARSTGR